MCPVKKNNKKIFFNFIEHVYHKGKVNRKVWGVPRSKAAARQQKHDNRKERELETESKAYKQTNARAAYGPGVGFTKGFKHGISLVLSYVLCSYLSLFYL